MNIYWMKYSPLESSLSATDPLALDYMAQQLGYLHLPNFTGRTSRARYYSVICYGLYICEEVIRRENLLFHDNTVLKLFELYEKYWAYAVIRFYNGGLRERDSKEAGLRGKRGAIKAYSSGIRTLGDEYRLISRQLELGGLGAYRSSLERFSLIKPSSLSLTMRGRELAENFLPVETRMRKQYDELLVESLISGKIVEKSGRASIDRFGEYGSLDLYLREEWDSEERSVLRRYILESDGITHAAARMIFSHRDVFNQSLLEGLYTLSNYPAGDVAEAQVRDSIRTIYSFELLSLELINAFCAMLLAAFDQGGRIGLTEAGQIVKPYLDHIYSDKLAEQVVKSPRYHDLINLFYGKDFHDLFTALLSGINVMEFQRAILKLHSVVEQKRQSARWFDMEGNSLVVYSGYEYVKANMDRLHNYKVYNLLSIIDDAGWRP